MTPRPVSQYLACFSGEDCGELTTDRSCEPAVGATDADAAVDEMTLAAAGLARQEGWSEGYSAGLAAVGREQEEACRSESVAFETRLLSERARWVEEESAGLSTKLTAALAAIETSIRASVARILRPVLIKSLRDRAVDELAENVSLILCGRDQRIIEISGPEDLLDSIRNNLASSAGSVAWTPSSSIDVKVVADQAIIESRIEAWVQRIDALAK